MFRPRLLEGKNAMLFLRRYWVLCSVLLLVLVPSGWSHAQSTDYNVIVMVPDGASQSLVTLARWYQGAPLNLDSLSTGFAHTFSADSVITDSAAAATAFATGHKTSTGFLGVGPDDQNLLTGFEPTAEPYAPVASVLEAARLKGKAVGLVATSRITHATPAAFGSHMADRSLEDDIMTQLVHQDLNVVLGGGAAMLIPDRSTYTTTLGRPWKGRRKDRQNLLKVLQDRGCTFVDNLSDLAGQQKGAVWGLFSPDHLTPQIDRPKNTPEPSLAAMTAKAIEILSQDPDGFFLLVEGSQVDWAGHGHDPAYMVTEFLAFDAAVGQALDFARSNTNTCVYIWPDHSTGGLTIGREKENASANRRRPSAYAGNSIEALVAPLKQMRASAAFLARHISDPENEDQVRSALAQYWNIAATEDDLHQIRTLVKSRGVKNRSMGLADALSTVICSNHLSLGWTTHGHCGEDVPLWSYGPRPLTGTFDNTELARKIAAALGVDLTQATRQLFIDISTIYPEFKVSRAQSNNLEVVIGTDMILPVNQDLLYINSKPHRLEGIVIHAPRADHGSGKVFVSQGILNLIKK